MRGAFSQRWLCRVPLCGVGVVPCSSQRRLLGLPPPRPIRLCLSSPQSCPCFAIGRGSRSKVVARPRPSASRYLRTLRERRGRRGRLVPPKTERGGFLPSKLGENLPRSVFRAVPCGHFARPLAALRVRASRSGNPTPTARANLARAHCSSDRLRRLGFASADTDLRSARLPSESSLRSSSSAHHPTRFTRRCPRGRCRRRESDRRGPIRTAR